MSGNSLRPERRAVRLSSKEPLAVHATQKLDLRDISQLKIPVIPKKLPLIYQDNRSS